MARILTFLCVVLLLAVVAALSTHTLASINQDIGRHLTLGEIIWDTHEVPSTNLFSYTNPDFPFINHHWFAEVMLYLGERAAGLKGLIVGKAALITAAFGLALAAGIRKDAFLVPLLAGLVGAGILMERTDVRPEVVSFLFFAWYLFVLLRERGRYSSALLWTLPLVQLLWVNSHIYFFMGPVAFSLALLQERLTTGTVPRMWWWVGGALVGVNLLNPALLDGALNPLLVFKNYGYSIVENQSPFFLRGFGYPQFTTSVLWVGIVLVLASMVLNFVNFRRRIAGNVLVLVTAAMALTMIRNFPLFGLSMIPAVGMNMYDVGIRDRARSAFAILAVILSALCYGIVSNQLSARMPIHGRFGLGVPQGAQRAVDFVRAHGVRGPMFNNFDVGSFLIWKLPEERVFIDGRPEAYPAEFIQGTYIPMQEDGAVWRRESERLNIQFVFWDARDITPWSRMFVARMRENAQWPLVYDDGSTLVFVRNSPAYRDLIRATRIPQ